MHFFYNIGLNILTSIVLCLARNHSSWLYRHVGNKVQLFIDGQGDAMKSFGESCMKKGLPTYWFHAASLGEYGIARPLILELRKQQDCNIILTFFSSTGVEALKNKTREQSGADAIGYLPLDCKRNVNTFLGTVRPDKAVFVKSEYWLNYLDGLYERNIPTFLVSAYIKKTSVFRRWYGGMYRKALRTYTKVYTQDSESAANLGALGFKRTTVMGDPLYDNAIVNGRMPYRNEVVEAFCSTAKDGVFVAGSIDTKHDLELTAALVNAHKDRKFLIVPHEVGKEDLGKITTALEGKSMLYGECSASTDFSDVQSLVIDYVGDLAKLYRYGKMTYVGGGFTPYLHSVIEPSVYGLPVAFGPMIERKAAPQLMMEKGVGCMVSTPEELKNWYDSLFDDSQQLMEITAKAQNFVKESSGKTPEVIKGILT